MPTLPNLFTSKAAAILLSIAVALTLLISTGSLSAAGPAQDGSDAPEITDDNCRFLLDEDGDGEGDVRIDGWAYIHQEKPVTGTCTFRLNAPQVATLIIESELIGWKSDVNLKEEPGEPTEFKKHPGDNEIANVEGAMSVTVKLWGDSPRSIRSRTMLEGYEHEVQIPEEFRLLEITAITKDGRRERLEQEGQSASDAYIQVHRKLLDSQEELPDWANTLANEWLEEGYPQVADGIIAQALEIDEDGGSGINRWMWAAIATWVVIIIAVVGGVAYYWINNAPRAGA